MLAATGVAACAAGMALAAPGMANAADSWSYQAALNPITANKVTGTGASWITVTGTSAEVKIQVNGLLEGAPHAQHIHVGAQGTCPTQAQLHNGLPSITVADGAPLYGEIGTSLTVDGDTTAAHGLDVMHFPQTGSYTYSRTIELDPKVVANLQQGTAVLVVHGIDYNGNGTYDDVLGASELDPGLPAEATDPALCGTFEPMQMAAVPAGAADTGGGSTAVSGASAAAESSGGIVGVAGGTLIVGVAGGALIVGVAATAGRRRGPRRTEPAHPRPGHAVCRRLTRPASPPHGARPEDPA
ncbi:MAG TPA: hypothetical protein VIU11_20820 [Nakamurella sp.]